MRKKNTEKRFFRKKSRARVAAIGVLAGLTLVGMATLSPAKTPEVLADSNLIKAVSMVDSAQSGNGIVSAGAAESTSESAPLVVRVTASVTIDDKTKTLDFIDGATVQDLLTKAKIEVNKDDIVSKGLGEVLTEGMKVQVTRVTKKTEELLKETEYETTYQDDETLPEGEENVLQEGENRVEKEVYTVTYHDGKQVKKELTSTELVQEGKEKIVVRGTLVEVEEIEEPGEVEESPAEEDNDSSSEPSKSEENHELSSDNSSSDSSEAKEPEKSGDSESNTESTYSGSVLTKQKGVNYGPTGKETYYNMDMSGIVSIMGQYGYTKDDYWIRSDGVKMLGDYVMVAANLDRFPRGTTVECSLGTAIVCDTGGFAYSNPTQLDIATNW